MNTKLGVAVILTPPLLVIRLTHCAQGARAEWEHIPDTEAIRERPPARERRPPSLRRR